MNATQKRPLMGTDNILELQDNGYKSTVSAISELIDNSIQAEATIIDVVLIKNTTRDFNEIEEILIVDNGKGMNQEIFNKALQMSSGSRSKARSGLGKYGQGLPNSSISQTKRVEVFTKQNNQILYNHIDLDEIHNSREPYLPDTEEVNEVNIPIFRDQKLRIGTQGTVVRWVQPNKVKPKTVKTLASHIELTVGRVFRYFLEGYQDGENFYKVQINIRTFDYNSHQYQENDFTTVLDIKPFDPMFLMENSQMNKMFTEINHPTSELFGEEAIKTFNVNYNGIELTTNVKIKISYCKKDIRESFGKDAGGTEFGKKYLHRNIIGTTGYNNISIVRAGREIDHGSFGFIKDVSKQTERWWSAEIHVEPVIDSIIGIDNKKQQASNIQFIEPESGDRSDNDEIILWISTILNENLKSVRKIIAEQTANTRSGRNNPGVKLPPGSDSEKGDPVPGIHLTPGTENDQKVRTEFFQWIKQRYEHISDAEIIDIVEYALAMKDNHIFVKSDLGDTQLFNYKVFGTKVLIEINYQHSFYHRLMSTFEGDVELEKSLRSIRLLISAMVNSEIVNQTTDNSLLADRKRIRNRMFESLDDYIEALYS
jgi:hypothetical protein